MEDTACSRSSQSVADKFVDTAIVRGQSPLSWNLFDDSRVAPIAQNSIDVLRFPFHAFANRPV